jgi:hypothetical protein
MSKGPQLFIFIFWELKQVDEEELGQRAMEA